MINRAVLVIDHKSRDLRGVLLVAYWLSVKYGVLPYLTNTKNEISCLIKYKPHVILLPHVRHPHQFEFLKFAKAQGTSVVLSLAEGFPVSKDQFLFSAGRDEYLSYVDLVLPWGPVYNSYIVENPVVRGIASVPVGSPRFDFHAPRYKPLLIGRRDFCMSARADYKLPTVIWMTNTIYANPHEGYDKFIEKMKRPTTSDSRIAHFIEPLTRDHQRVFENMSDYYEKISKAFPRVNYLIKVHPSEPRQPYEDRFNAHPNIKILPVSDLSFTNYLAHADILCNWRCTTSAEAWMVDISKPVISIEPRGLETSIFDYLSSGNDTVSDYGQFEDKMTHYLNGGKVAVPIVSARDKFIAEYLLAADGRSAERCAEAIFSHISARACPVWSWHNYRVFLKYLRNYRFNRKWLALNRGQDHPKYISRGLIDDEMGKLSGLFGRSAEYRVEM